MDHVLPSTASDFNIILGSGSPRRKFLLTELGWEFKVKSADVEENFPDTLRREEIALFLCRLKADALSTDLKKNELVITADTIVWINELVLNKPQNRDEAIDMLTLLSGNMHEVITGVCLRTRTMEKIFHVVTKVYFKHLSLEEIVYYVDKYKPFDKAGAYGAQEWIGYVAVERIEGSYFNVMGLPVKELYEELAKLQPER